MTWLATIALMCEGILLVWVGYEWGRFMEKKQQASREEAIRLQAYKDGRLSMAGTMVDGWPDYGGHGIPLTPDEYRRMYMGTWAPGIKNDTKESS